MHEQMSANLTTQHYATNSGSLVTENSMRKVVQKAVSFSIQMCAETLKNSRHVAEKTAGSFTLMEPKKVIL